MTARKTWANGERLTSSDLNSMFDAAIASVGGFLIDNVPAGVTTPFGRFVASQATAYQNRPLAGRAGAVVGLAWRKNGTITAGTIDVQTNIGGTGSSAVVLDSASGSIGVVTFGTPRTFGEANGLGLDAVASAGLTPATVDIGVELLVEYDRP